MAIFFPEALTALLSIIFIDLILGGDNAIVIGMAARNLPAKQLPKAIIIGTGGAIIIRILTTIAAVWLLKIPGLLLVGGILLLGMAYKLLTENKCHDSLKCSTSMWGAVRTIIIADAVMGLDNVLAVAGAAHGNYALVVFGLMFSIPIVVWWSTLIIKAIQRFPVIIDLGAAVIAFTAARMILEEPFLSAYFTNVWVHWGIIFSLIALVLAAGKATQARRHSKEQHDVLGVS